MKKWIYLAYAVVCYLMFLAVYVYLGAFMVNFVVPKSIDSSSGAPVGWAAAIDIGLLLLFGLQHSIMARPWFKQVWTKLVPEPIERSTYVLCSNLAVILLIWQWQSIPLNVWNVNNEIGRAALLTLFVIGLLLVPGASLMINHFDLFGLRQVWLRLRDRQYTTLPFHTPMLYSIVRHPLYVGWFMVFWITPTMSVGHLLLAGLLTGYIVVASKIEERDLIQHFGRVYKDYQQRVPAFVPRMRFEKSRAMTDVERQPEISKPTTNAQNFKLRRTQSEG